MSEVSSSRPDPAPFGDIGKLVVVGAGKMGSAIVQGLISSGFPGEQLVIIEPTLCEEARAQFADMGAQARSAWSPDLAQGARYVLLAVKPQVMAEVVGGLDGLREVRPVFISIAAGKSIGFFEVLLGHDARIVRVMPNTPAAVRMGISGAVANANVTDRQKAACTDLLSATGAVAWIEDEGQMDAVTAVSGSGPAYVFHFVEALAAAGVAEGLDADQAMQLARTTVIGAGALLRASDQPVDELRRNVTSPGGTTEAALGVLMREPDGLCDLLRDAVRAAARRSKELEG